VLHCGGRILLERKSVRDALDWIFESILTNDLNVSCHVIWAAALLQAMPSGRLLTGDATGLAQLWRYSDPALLEAIVSLDPRTAFAPVAPYGKPAALLCNQTALLCG